MPALIFALSLPELAAIGLAGGVPLALAVLCWPLLRSNASTTGRRRRQDDNAMPTQEALLGLAGQWSIHAHKLAAGLDRQSSAIGLHRQAATQLGALDYEIDRLWRETRAVKLDRAAASLPMRPSALERTRQPSAPTTARHQGATPAVQRPAFAS